MKRSRSRSTSFEVAALAGVSQSAVSRAFTPGTSISEATRARIFEAARKINYVPNSIASSLTTRRSNIVAIILGNLSNPFYVQALEEFSTQLQQRGRQILTFTVEPNDNNDNAIMKVLQYQVDGLIVTSAQISTRMTAICHERGIPVVLFNRYIPGSNASGVRCDNAAGASLLADTFLAAGAKVFGILTGDSRGTTSQDRVNAFKRRLVDAGINPADIMIAEGGSTYHKAGQAVRSLMQTPKGRGMDALFAVNDIMAMGAMDELRHRGLRIPCDIMVAGFDGIPDGARSAYRLTTIRQPMAQMVKHTIDMLNLDDPDAPILEGVDKRLTGQLIWRNSIRRPLA